MRLVLASNNPGKLAELQACSRRSASTWCAGRARRAARPRSRTPPSSRTRWPRRATRRAAANGAGDRRRLRACASTRSAARPASPRRTSRRCSQRHADRESLRRAQDAANNALLLEHMHGEHRPPRALRQHAGGGAPCRRSRAADRRRPLAGEIARDAARAAAASASTRWSSSPRSARPSPSSPRRRRTRTATAARPRGRCGR